MSGNTLEERLSALYDYVRTLPSDVLAKRMVGRFFTPLELIWTPHTETIDTSWYDAIVRTPEAGRRLYDASVSDTNLQHPLSPSCPSSRTNTNQAPDEDKFDMFDNSTPEAAHLIPNASVCHKAYGFVAQGATGKTVATPQYRLKLLNGVRLPGSRGRISHSGLKHHKYNKMYLCNQKEMYDANPPSLIIVPLLPLDQILDWNGINEYHIMAITCGKKAKVCGIKVLLAAREICSEDEVEMGRNVLETFVKALASSVKQHPLKESIAKRHYSGKRRKDPSLVKWGRLKEYLEGDGSSISLPENLPNLDWNNIRVAKAKMSLETSLPDPYLVAVKAAINFSALNGTKLMPASFLSSSNNSSNGEVNTSQMQDVDVSEGDRRDFSSVAASFSNPHRQITELFSDN